MEAQKPEESSRVVEKLSQEEIKDQTNQFPDAIQSNDDRRSEISRQLNIIKSHQTQAIGNIQAGKQTAVPNFYNSTEKKRKLITCQDRIQRLLDDVNAKLTLPSQIESENVKRFKMDNYSMKLFVDYASELSSAILEESSLLAKHRNSSEINISDIKLIIGMFTCSI